MESEVCATGKVKLRPSLFWGWSRDADRLSLSLVLWHKRKWTVSSDQSAITSQSRRRDNVASSSSRHIWSPLWLKLDFLGSDKVQVQRVMSFYSTRPSESPVTAESVVYLSHDFLSFAQLPVISAHWPAFLMKQQSQQPQQQQHTPHSFSRPLHCARRRRLCVFQCKFHVHQS